MHMSRDFFQFSIMVIPNKQTVDGQILEKVRQ